VCRLEAGVSGAQLETLDRLFGALNLECHIETRIEGLARAS